MAGQTSAGQTGWLAARQVVIGRMVGYWLVGQVRIWTPTIVRD